MEFADKNGKYYEALAPVVEGLGFSIVELSANSRQDGLHISLVIFSKDGVTVKDCERVHKLAAARMEVINDVRDIYFEVSSPGVNRNMKSAGEFAVFVDRSVKVICDGDSEWTYGDIISADDKNVVLKLDNENDNKNEETKSIPYSRIRKAKLDFSWEEA